MILFSSSQLTSLMFNRASNADFSFELIFPYSVAFLKSLSNIVGGSGFKKSSLLYILMIKSLENNVFFSRECSHSHIDFSFGILHILVQLIILIDVSLLGSGEYLLKDLNGEGNLRLSFYEAFTVLADNRGGKVKNRGELFHL